MPRKRSGKNKILKLVILVASLVILLLALLLILEKRNVTDFFNQDDSSATGAEDSINYDPPTEQEQQAGDDIKDEMVNGEANPQADSGDVNVVITDAAQYDNIVEVRSFISNHYEDGTCTITFTKSGQTISKTTSAYRDATTTVCTNPLINRTEFPSAGDWQLVVYYASSGASGQSEKLNVAIQ